MQHAAAAAICRGMYGSVNHSSVPEDLLRGVLLNVRWSGRLQVTTGPRQIPGVYVMRADVLCSKRLLAQR